jgi:uncharacterized protein
LSKPEFDLFNFPCAFPVKVIGKDAEDFAEIVTEIIRHHVPDLAADAVTTRPSAGGKYIAVTVNFIATSREQLDAIYRELSGNVKVLYVL